MPDEPMPAPAPGPSGAPSSPEQNQANPALNQARNDLGGRLNVPGGLEVAESDASKEFLERQRQETGDNIQTAADMPGEEGAFQGDAGGLKELLAEANLSTRHLKFCCGGVVFIGLLVAGAYFGIRFIQGLEDRPDPVVEEEPEVVEEVKEVPEEEVVVEEETSSSSDEYGFLDPSVMTGVMVGEEEAQPDAGTQAGEDLGEALVSDDALAQMIRDFAEMYEAMQVDVNELLDQSSDRQAAYDDYRNELNYLLYVGRQNTEQLEADSERLVAKFAAVEDEKDNWEERFFTELRDLDAYASVAALDEFIVSGEEVVRLRAEYLARQKLLEYYAIVMESMELRVTDLEFNEEALVKGVRVVDIEGSDIDLIIQESEL